MTAKHICLLITARNYNPVTWFGYTYTHRNQILYVNYAIITNNTGVSLLAMKLGLFSPRIYSHINYAWLLMLGLTVCKRSE